MTRVLQFGLGPIGCATARLVAERTGLQLVAGVDVDPAKVGRDLGEVAGMARVGVPVVATLEEALAREPADAALHTTSSYFPLFREQAEGLLKAGLDVVSTSEELSFPWHDNAEEADALHKIAVQTGRTILGTGVNPGFLMDSLPLFLTALSQTVERISIRRVINASKRRGPFQAKIGSGLTPEAFMERMEAGRMGHVGLPESIAMIFDTLGQTLSRYESSVEPVIASALTETEHFSVKPGMVKGLHQTASGFTADGELVSLTFIASLDSEEDSDTITISGRPNLEVTLKGTNGDLATVAIAVNAIRRVVDAPPGLMTMRDLPIVSWSP